MSSLSANDLLKKVRKIEIKTRALSHQIFAGEYHSAFKGRGMAFSEVREYQYGDDVRNMDWNVTARLRAPYVKVFEEEREMTVVLLIDTVSHKEEPYYYSADRARFMSEDQANVIYSMSEFGDALYDGMAFKTWETIGDNRVRNSHLEVEGMTIPIEEPFMLEGGLVQFPGDDSLGADSSEIIGCRCSLSFS